MISFDGSNLYVYHFWLAQIESLLLPNVSTTISNKYIDLADLFLPDLAIQLPEDIGINNNIIKLVDHEQSLYKSI